MRCNQATAQRLVGMTKLTYSPEGWTKTFFGQYGQITKIVPITSDKVREDLNSFAIAQITFIGAKFDLANI